MIHTACLTHSCVCLCSSLENRTRRLLTHTPVYFAHSYTCLCVFLDTHTAPLRSLIHMSFLSPLRSLIHLSVFFPRKQDTHTLCLSLTHMLGFAHPSKTVHTHTHTASLTHSLACCRFFSRLFTPARRLLLFLEMTTRTHRVCSVAASRVRATATRVLPHLPTDVDQRRKMVEKAGWLVKR